MKVVTISDTHNYNEKIKVPDGDILIHAGDLTSMGYFGEIARALDWLSSLPHQYKILVPGNHDFFAMDSSEAFNTLCKQRSIHCLLNNKIAIDGLKIWGSPYTPTFGDWAFMHSESELFRIFEKIPNDLDILITHGPPKGILDEVGRGDNTGSSSLLECVMRAKPRFHIFGHIHEYGCEIKKINETTFINACVLDPSYRAWNKAIVEFEI
jgi:Icc-related predicted phosphoesterase